MRNWRKCCLACTMRSAHSCNLMRLVCCRTGSFFIAFWRGVSCGMQLFYALNMALKLTFRKLKRAAKVLETRHGWTFPSALHQKMQAAIKKRRGTLGEVVLTFRDNSGFTIYEKVREQIYILSSTKYQDKLLFGSDPMKDGNISTQQP